jgi:AcrR family transcriptional regulator
LSRTSRPRTKKPAPPRRSRRARKHQVLLDTAVAMVGEGRVPSVPELAMAANVSRATAYRYFPSRSALINAVVARSLEPVREFRPIATDGWQRVREMFDQTFPRFKEFEPHMRAALQLSLEHGALERAGLLEEEPFRRGFRRLLLRRAAAPLRRKLGAKGFDRLLRSLSLIYGIEPYVVFKDIWGMTDREVERLTKWVLDAMIAAALRDAKPTAHKAKASGSKAERS